MKRQQYQHIKLVNNFTVDFNKLALLEPSLRPSVLILNSRVVWNFSNQENLIKLTKAIMKHIFHFQWECPFTNLCPRIPSRINYLLWLSMQVKEPIDRVLDVGTGATLIYPLLGCALFKWKFTAIEINEKSYQSSKKIIEINQLSQSIDLRFSTNDQDSETILYPIINEEQTISLVVCNPPFFEEDMPTLSKMEDQEHHFEQGQYGFFFLLYKDSFRYKNIKNFSCLIGRATDFDEIRRFLIEQHKQGFLQLLKFGDIVQGKNKRFIIMWRVKHGQL